MFEADDCMRSRVSVWSWHVGRLHAVPRVRGLRGWSSACSFSCQFGLGFNPCSQVLVEDWRLVTCRAATCSTAFAAAGKIRVLSQVCLQRFQLPESCAGGLRHGERRDPCHLAVGIFIQIHSLSMWFQQKACDDAPLPVEDPGTPDDRRSGYLPSGSQRSGREASD